jgi:hypothetical protein
MFCPLTVCEKQSKNKKAMANKYFFIKVFGQ